MGTCLNIGLHQQTTCAVVARQDLRSDTRGVGLRRRIVQWTASECFEREGRIDECEDAGVRDHPTFMYGRISVAIQKKET
jgi:hypothetical protein